MESKHRWGQHNEENVHNAEEADRSEVIERDQEVA